MAICASVVAACVCVLLISGEYHSAHFKMDTYDRELQGWEACRQTNPDYFKANEQAVNSCLTSINEARDNFWVKLPKAQFAGLLVVAGLASASGGYLTTWAVVWLIGFVICKLVRLLTFPFRYNTNRKAPKKRNLQSFPAKA